jgi:hypothetical protein
MKCTHIFRFSKEYPITKGIIKAKHTIYKPINENYGDYKIFKTEYECILCGKTKEIITCKTILWV